MIVAYNMMSESIRLTYHHVKLFKAFYNKYGKKCEQISHNRGS